MRSPPRPVVHRRVLHILGLLVLPGANHPLHRLLSSQVHLRLPGDVLVHAFMSLATAALEVTGEVLRHFRNLGAAQAVA